MYEPTIFFSLRTKSSYGNARGVLRSATLHVVRLIPNSLGGRCRVSPNAHRIAQNANIEGCIVREHRWLNGASNPSVPNPTPSCPKLCRPRAASRTSLQNIAECAGKARDRSNQVRAARSDTGEEPNTPPKRLVHPAARSAARRSFAHGRAQLQSAVCSFLRTASARRIRLQAQFL